MAEINLFVLIGHSKLDERVVSMLLKVHEEYIPVTGLRGESLAKSDEEIRTTTYSTQPVSGTIMKR
jgi:hypothetical protein